LKLTKLKKTGGSIFNVEQLLIAAKLTLNTRKMDEKAAKDKLLRHGIKQIKKVEPYPGFLR